MFRWFKKQNVVKNTKKYKLAIISERQETRTVKSIRYKVDFVDAHNKLQEKFITLMDEFIVTRFIGDLNSEYEMNTWRIEQPYLHQLSFSNITYILNNRYFNANDDVTYYNYTLLSTSIEEELSEEKTYTIPKYGFVEII